MRSNVHIVEFYDLFNVMNSIVTVDSKQKQLRTSTNDQIPDNIEDTNRTNTFRGFWNNNDYNTVQKPIDLIPIAGQHKSPQETNTLTLNENGDILCFPPNVSVPYWNKIIFKNYDYSLSNWKLNDYGLKPIPHDSSIHVSSGSTPVALPNYWFYLGDDAATPPKAPEIIPLYGYDNKNNSLLPTEYKLDGTKLKLLCGETSEFPLFMKFDEYQSRSKCIYSMSSRYDKSEIEFKFGYHKGSQEPIKLNLAFSANQYYCDKNMTTQNHYNKNLNKFEISEIVRRCNWSIEWIYEPESGE